ncbi:LAQU0S04e06304g1_1 [Lachancea quebecensis]|uniref:LAQU0S04e06304g1_1 n=1 Tax=Lachancea quebecensis TaxID=1654605 RepID=A0A0P1KPR0_9SACH|nr:LAQU0S04e06304g1_1 [Lachancea quebecensis]
MSRHQFDLEMCLKQPGTHIGKLCDKCDGKCPICDSYVRPKSKVRICEQCSFGANWKKCIICGQMGTSDAFYCWECCRLEKNKDGCPRILNVGSNRTDKHFEKKASTD